MKPRGRSTGERFASSRQSAERTSLKKRRERQIWSELNFLTCIFTRSRTSAAPSSSSSSSETKKPRCRARFVGVVRLSLVFLFPVRRLEARNPNETIRSMSATIYTNSLACYRKEWHQTYYLQFLFPLPLSQRVIQCSENSSLQKKML